MSLLFTPSPIGTLTLPNRLIRSATAERLADAEGRVLPGLARLYRELARGGVGLIVSGHLYVDRSGKAHPEMAGIHADSMLSGLAELTRAVHEEGGLVAAQLNHGGRQCASEVVDEPVSSSSIRAKFLSRQARELSEPEIERLIEAFAAAAGRAKAAGFDAVQLHAAHGYLIGQFLSPFLNRRSDRWGGSPDRRRRFLAEVTRAVRAEVGSDYPLFLKLGVIDAVEGGLTLEESRETVARLEAMGFDAVEVSGNLEKGRPLNVRLKVRRESHEAYFRPQVRTLHDATRLPIALVGGIRSRRVMDEVLESGDVQFVSLARPLICEPRLPAMLRSGEAERSSCRAGNRCWPKESGTGIRCRCLEKERAKQDG